MYNTSWLCLSKGHVSEYRVLDKLTPDKYIGGCHKVLKRLTNVKFYCRLRVVTYNIIMKFTLINKIFPYLIRL